MKGNYITKSRSYGSCTCHMKKIGDGHLMNMCCPLCHTLFSSFGSWVSPIGQRLQRFFRIKAKTNVVVFYQFFFIFWHCSLRVALFLCIEGNLQGFFLSRNKNQALASRDVMHLDDTVPFYYYFKPLYNLIIVVMIMILFMI